MTVQVLPPGRRLPAGPGRAVSYLDDGRQVIWEPPIADAPIACDAERYDRPARVELARRYGLPEDPLGFARAWTRAEAGAKLADAPILAWLMLGGHRAQPHGWHRTLVLPVERVVVTLARAAGR